MRRWQGFLLAILFVAGAASPAPAILPAEAARKVDQSLQEEVLTDATLAPPADEQVLLRRLYLDVIGRAPSPEEVIAWSLDPSATKRAKTVDWLLNDSRFGSNWATYWRDVIFYRRSDDRSLAGSPTLEAQLTKKLNENRPWDEIARDFITAKGDVMEEGDTAIIFAQMGKPEETVAEVSRIFLGIQIQCAQCHDHPTDRWKREQFHQLAAFFPRVAVRPNPQQGPRSFTVSADDSEPRFRRGDNAMRFRGTLEHRMPDLKDPSAAGQVIQPVFFVSGQSVPLGTADEERRGALADWLTSPENPWFAKAVVNRIWAELVGEGFYEPVDDLGPDRQCSAPKTLELLSQAFIESGYDLKWLYRTILATDAYARTSRDRRAPDETPFAANVSQRLRSDQLYSNLLAALGVAEPTFPQMAGAPGFAALRSPRRAFAATFGYDPSERRDTINATIAQALAVMNSPTVNAAISARGYGPLTRLVANTPSDEDLTVELYLRAVSREPSDKELEVCLGHFKQSSSRAEAAEDLMWSLLNSTEFLYRR